MDGFSDVLAKRFNSPQEMIEANSQADAEEMKSLQDRVDRYEGVLEKFNETVDTLDRRITEIQVPEVSVTAPAVDTEEYTSKLSGVEGKLQEHVHKENVRVYRNVQAALVDELGKQTEALGSKMNETGRSLEESLDKRIEEKLDRKLEEKLEEKLNAKLESVTADLTVIKKNSRGKAVLWMQIIGFMVVAADLAINILRLLGII